MKIESFGLSDVGCKREKNEDSYLINDELSLLMVADGMGGHVGGEFASKLAVETVGRFLTDLTKNPNATLPGGGYRGWLQTAVSVASRKIFEEAAHDSSLSGMGTTAVALLFKKNRVYVANVGDSRCYRVRGNKIEQMTTDHSLVAEQIRAGILKAKEAKEHRLKNIITRSVGFQETVEVDVEARAVKPGDIYMLCTDGLHNLVEDDELRDVLTHKTLKEAGKHLIDIAKARGGDDNITVVLAKAISLEEMDPGEDEESTLQY